MILLGGMLVAQEWPGSQEKVKACTDRSIYISGEKIRFSALIGNSVPDAASRIVYCELVTPGGEAVAQGKYTVQSVTGHGCLQVPEEALTGIYYLKFYTRAMRNTGPEGYHYIPLKIINPHKEELLQTGSPDTAGWSRSAEKEVKSTTILIISDKEEYSTRETISVQLKGLDPEGTYCLAAAPAAAAGLYKSIPVQAGASTNGNGSYYPETRGVSLTGNVRDRQTGERVAGIRVNLSLLGEKDVMATLTDSAGRFFFALPDLSGSWDLFLSASAPGNSKIELRVDNDFCTRSMHLPPGNFSLDENEKAAAYRMLVNAMVDKEFQPPQRGSHQAKDPVQNSFYGEPTQVLAIEKYIELPTLEEYFNELPLAVKVRKSQGKKHFRFFSTQAEMNIYDPLVLIDWVAVSDMESIMAINPQELDRIELVNAPYIKGSIIYGGIISLISQNNDFAGIDLPSAGAFVNYRLLEDCTAPAMTEELPDNMPDARNTLYWNPDILPDVKGETIICFQASHTPGTYTIILTELNTGKQSTAEFNIRRQ